MKRYNPFNYFLFCIVVLIISASGVVWAIYELNYIAIGVFVFFLLVGVFKSYKHYLLSSRKINFMFNAIDCDEYSFNFPENVYNSIELCTNQSLNRIKEVLVNAKLRTLEREKFYEKNMDSVQTGVLSINENGNVFNANNEVKRLFGLYIFTHINQTKTLCPKLPEVLKEIREGESKQFSFDTEKGDITFSLVASGVDLGGRRLKIIAISDIKNVLDEKEVESWIKLTRILTHEIMNSLAPITSLSGTLMKINTDKEIERGLETINQTSKSLVAFVENYRKFSRIQIPQKQAFELLPFIQNICKLICPKEIDLDMEITPADTLIFADDALMTQVFVNIIKNSVEATANLPQRKITIKSHIDDKENVVIRIANNGSAIEKEIAENIFMPFFTTKQNGSGIGLSVSRQIMYLHSGSLTLSSNMNDKIEFTLTI